MSGSSSLNTAMAVKPDSSHGWIIVTASFLVYCISGGIFYSQGILFPEYVKAFGAGEAVTAWACSIMTGLCMLSAMVSGWLLDMVGHRSLCVLGSFLAGLGFILSAFVYNLTPFFLTYSITVGVGMGTQYLAAIMIPQLYFVKRRAIATGITVSGAPVGGMVFSPLVQFFISTYGWRSTMLLIGAICLNGCALGILMVPPNKNKKTPTFPKDLDPEPPEPRPLSRLKVDMGSVLMQSIENMRSAISLEITDTAAETKCQFYAKKLARIFDVSALKQVIVLVVLINFFLFDMGYMVPYVFLPLRTADHGIDPATTAYILSVSGGADFMGRIALGLLGNCECINSIHLFEGSSMLAGLASILSLFATDTKSFFVYAFVYGFSVGGWITISTVSLAELLGVENLAKAYGSMQIAGALAFFTTSPLHALMMEAANSLSVPFISAGAMQVAGGLVLLFYYHTCYQKNELPKPDQPCAEEQMLGDSDDIGFKEGPDVVVTLEAGLLPSDHVEHQTPVATVA